MSSVRRITFPLATAATVAAALLVLGPAGAAPGDLDPTFGTDGIAQTDVGSGTGANDLVLQPDGKIVLVGSPPYGGNMALARYLPDGSLDPTFGSGGIVVGPPGTANAVALQADGDIVVAGSGANFMFTLARFLPDGSPDLGYGVNGRRVRPARNCRGNRGAAGRGHRGGRVRLVPKDARTASSWRASTRSASSTRVSGGTASSAPRSATSPTPMPSSSSPTARSWPRETARSRPPRRPT